MRVVLLLLRKVLREQRFTLLFCYVVATVFFTVGAYLFVTFGETNVDALGQVSPELISGIFGGLLGGLTPLDTWLLTLFTHPLVMTLCSVLVIATTSRSLAGEIDRGTVDLLLSCPVARWQPVAAVVMFLLVALTIMMALLWGSMHVGFRIGEIEPPSRLPAFGWVAVNLFVLFFAVSGVATMISASCAEQGKAIARALGFLVVSFLLHLIAAMWSLVEIVDWVSLFHYYEPQPTVQSGSPPVFDLTVLALVGTVGFVVAFAVFMRRDIATV